MSLPAWTVATAEFVRSRRAHDGGATAYILWPARGASFFRNAGSAHRRLSRSADVYIGVLREQETDASVRATFQAFGVRIHEIELRLVRTGSGRRLLDPFGRSTRMESLRTTRLWAGGPGVDVATADRRSHR